MIRRDVKQVCQITGATDDKMWILVNSYEVIGSDFELLKPICDNKGGYIAD